jgi:uncharacterized membrane protein YkoI
MKTLLACLAILPLAAFAEDDGKLTIEIPSSVQATIAKERGEGKVSDFRRVNESDGTTYVVGITVDGKKYALSLDAAGRVMRKALDVEDTGPKELGIEGVPAKVRLTFQREAGTAAIKDIEVHEAKTTYVTEIVSGTRRYRIEVDADGALLSKEYVGEHEAN